MIEELGIKTLDDVEVKGKTVGVRVDFNSPIDPKTGHILDDTRIRVHGETTIKELSDRGARVVILAHQGRKGEPDFVSLKEHAARLSAILSREVKFVDDIFGEKAKNAIRSLKDGDILVLENVRFWPGETKKADPETHSKSELVRELAPLFQVYVVDAFAAAHRPHASMVGFAPVVPHFVAGRIMEREIRALWRVRNNPERPSVYILGGAKAEDSAEIVKTVFEEDIADKVLTGGLVANLFLYAAGHDIGRKNVEVLEKKGFLGLVDDIRGLLDKYGEKILLPVDLGVKRDGERVDVPVSELPVEGLIWDIGRETAKRYADEILAAKTVVMNGPMGVFEEPGFETGTVEVFEAMAKSSAFTLIGGGHTLAAAHRLGYLDKVSHVSTGGGALIEYLVKGTLPVIEVLRKYSR